MLWVALFPIVVELAWDHVIESLFHLAYSVVPQEEDQLALEAPVLVVRRVVQADSANQPSKVQPPVRVTVPKLKL